MATTSMNSEEVRSNEGSRGKDNNNEVVRNVWEESTNGKSVSNQKAHRSKDERNMVITSNDYKIGEAWEICQPSIVLGTESQIMIYIALDLQRIYLMLIYAYQRKAMLANHKWYIANQQRLESSCLLK